MTILCPAEFADAARFASQADDALEATIFHCGNADERRKLEARRGQATKTLLACFGERARSDDIDNKNPNLPLGSEVRYADGSVRTIQDIGEYGRPIRETFIFKDMAPHSFFFREEWLDPNTRQRVEVFDRCWYIFGDGTTQEAANELSDEELEEVWRNSNGRIERTFFEGRITTLAAGGSHTPFVETMRRRIGVCGGIIWHADWDGGQPTAYGSWSTHT